MFNRLFSKSPQTTNKPVDQARLQLEVLPKDARFQQRLSYRIVYYRVYDLPSIFAGEGRKRAEKYIDSLEENIARLQLESAATAAAENEDRELLRMVIRDTTECFSLGALGTSDVLRQHLFDALCEHLNVNKQQLKERMTESEKRLILGGRGNISEVAIRNEGFRVANKMLDEAYKDMYEPGWRLREEEKLIAQEFEGESKSYIMRPM